uniref:Uncharacterized protein LOC111099856 n=1 Tax=Crassostrea virginica TaxID=6565 RepID=A0A8B8A6E3_CRAVI|nr:uncharacterized protein LOC111099856 [Crassostrea virginica]
MQGSHSVDLDNRAVVVQAGEGGLFMARTKPIGIYGPHRLILTYMMAANVHDYHPQVIYKSPHHFDKLVILIRGCRDEEEGVCVWEGEAECTRRSEPELRDRWCATNTLVYHSYYPHDYANKKRTVCIDVNPRGDRRFMEFGARVNCNNPNGCNLHNIGATSVMFSQRFEPGTCEYFQAHD